MRKRQNEESAEEKRGKKRWKIKGEKKEIAKGTREWTSTRNRKKGNEEEGKIN